MQDDIIEICKRLAWEHDTRPFEALPDTHSDLGNLAFLETSLGLTLPADLRRFWVHGGTHRRLSNSHGTLELDTSKWIAELTMESHLPRLYLGSWVDGRDEDPHTIFYDRRTWQLFRCPADDDDAEIPLAPDLAHLLLAVAADQPLV